jgi:hypothetical protein
VSCVIVSPFAIERSKRRMIFPDRVFGRLSPKRMSFGLAIGPISFATQLRNSVASYFACITKPIWFAQNRSASTASLHRATGRASFVAKGTDPSLPTPHAHASRYRAPWAPPW